MCNSLPQDLADDLALAIFADQGGSFEPTGGSSGSGGENPKQPPASEGQPDVISGVLVAGSQSSEPKSQAQPSVIP